VYCPECRDSFPQSNLCKHYAEYGYKSGESEIHFINLIKEHYEKYSFFDRKKFLKKHTNYVTRQLLEKVNND
jgi:hypothetical protein